MKKNEIPSNYDIWGQYPVSGRSEAQLEEEAKGLETIVEMIEKEKDPIRRAMLQEIEAQARCC